MGGMQGGGFGYGGAQAAGVPQQGFGTGVTAPPQSAGGAMSAGVPQQGFGTGVTAAPQDPGFGGGVFGAQQTPQTLAGVSAPPSGSVNQAAGPVGPYTFNNTTSLGGGNAAGTAGSIYMPASSFSGSSSFGTSAPGTNMQLLQQYQQPFMDMIGQIPQETLDALTATARGDYLTGNPHLQAEYDRVSGMMTDNFNNNVLAELGSQFAGSGRTGSGIHGEVINQAGLDFNRSLNDLSTQTFFNNYELERDRQLGAAGNLAGIIQGQSGLGLQALGQGGQLYDSDQNRGVQLQGIAAQDRATSAANANARMNREMQMAMQQAQLDFGRYQHDNNDAFRRFQYAGDDAYRNAQLGANVYGMGLNHQASMMGLLPQFNQMGYNDINQLINAGQMGEGYAERQRLGGWDALQRYQSLIGGNYGGQSTVTGPAQGGGFGGALAGGLSGFAAGGPWGAAGGALAGWLG